MKILLFYCTLLALFMNISGFAAAKQTPDYLLQAVFLPVTLFLIFSSFKSLTAIVMKKILIYYDFIIVFLVALSGFLNAQSYVDLISAIPFIPLVVYFGIFIFPRQRRAIILPQVVKPPAVEGEILEEEKAGVDSNRRMFLKLIGSAGFSVFFFALFAKKAEAAFFGSVPGPGTLKIKDTAGNQIDPSEKQPTDGYNITKIDDSSSPVYYGFVNKDGAWFIIQEDNGTYLYFKGSSDFSGNWEVKGDLEYDYFDEIFS